MSDVLTLICSKCGSSQPYPDCDEDNVCSECGLVVSRISLRRVLAGVKKLRDTSRACHADMKLWRNARTLDDIGELTAQWLEGRIRHQPGYHGGPADETSEIAPVLAAANRAGFITIGSQPGVQGDNGYSCWSQCASVNGFATSLTLSRIRSLVVGTELEIYAYRTPKWKWPFRPRLEQGDIYTTGYGAVGGVQLSRGHLDLIYPEISDDLYEEIARIWQVSVIDPVPARNDLLWSILARL